MSERGEGKEERVNERRERKEREGGRQGEKDV